MKLQVQSYNNGGTVYNAEAEETKFRSYSLEHEFNRPAKAIITLADVDGTIIQKYNADANDVYLGVGKVTIEDPTGTDIFFGRIMIATGNSETRTVTLECEDWLSQLDEELITYDMREDLDGSGLRQSIILSDKLDTDGNNIQPANNIAGTKYIYVDNILTADAHNDMFQIFTAGMAGSNSWKTGPYTYTHTAGGAGVDVFVGVNPDDISDLWAEDTDYHSVGDAGGGWNTVYNFKSWVPDSDFHVSTSAARIKVIYETGSNDINLGLYNGATYDTLEEDVGSGSTARTTKTYEVPNDLISGMFDANGEVRVQFIDADDGAIKIYYIHVEVDTVTTGLNYDNHISDGETYRLTGHLDFSTDQFKVWDGLPYCIAQYIYKHIDSAETPGSLITDGDGVVTLTCAATIEHTTGISSRKYKDMTRLQILTDLAGQDMSSFWITLGGTTVTWKKTFGADTMQLTDGKVDSWQSLQDYGTVRNSYDVYGARIGDTEIYEQSQTAASITKFLATRSKVIRNAGLVSDADAALIGTTLTARDNDVKQMVNCTITGNTATAAHATTIKLGEIVEITSSYLWPTAAKDYIVTRFVYDSEQHETYLTLHPKVSIGITELDTPNTQGKRMKAKLDDVLPEVADNITQVLT